MFREPKPVGVFLDGNRNSLKVKVNVAQRHLQSWTAALYNLGSGSWLALTVVPRRKQVAARSPR